MYYYLRGYIDESYSQPQRICVCRDYVIYSHVSG